MEYQEAIEVLKKMIEKDDLVMKEKEAIRTAIGALGWFKLGKNRVDRMIKSQKAKRDKMKYIDKDFQY